jgi:starch phosphorylase
VCVMATVEVQKAKSNYSPNEIIAGDLDIARVMQLLEDGTFNREEPGIFNVITSGLRSPHDQWLTIADLRSYIDAQKSVNEAYCDKQHWNHMSILNCATSGYFSSDRTIGQYADEIWKTRAV